MTRSAAVFHDARGFTQDMVRALPDSTITMPKPPRPLGTPDATWGLAALSVPTSPFVRIDGSGRTPLPAREPVVHTSDGATATFAEFDLRTEDVWVSPAVPLLLEPAGGPMLRVTWHATCLDAHGAVRGSIELPVRDEQTPLGEITDVP